MGKVIVVAETETFEPTTEDVGDGSTPGPEDKTQAAPPDAPSPTTPDEHAPLNRPNKIAGLPILTAGEQADFVKLLVYGDPGAGKTRFAATSEDVDWMRPILFIDVEGGTKTFKHLYPNIQVVRLHNRYNKQREIARYGWDMFVTLVEHLATDDIYNTIIVDSLSEIYSLGLFKVMQELVKEKAHRDPDIPDKREWAKASAVVAAEVRKLIHTPKNIVMTALRDTRTDLEGRVIAHTPVLAGKLTFRIAGFFNELCYLETFTEGKEVKRRLLTQPANKYLAKSRDDRMPITIINPTMADIAQYIDE